MSADQIITRLGRALEATGQVQSALISKEETPKSSRNC